jgi:hypothetical protein
MNPIGFTYFLIACSTVCAAGASDIPPERMRAIAPATSRPMKEPAP